MSSPTGRDSHARWWLGSGGLVLMMVGVAGLARSLTQAGDAVSRMQEVSQTILVVGSIFVGLAVLAKYRVTVDAAYQLGKDIGEEKGYQKGRRTSRPVVVDLAYPPAGDDEYPIRVKPE